MFTSFLGVQYSIIYNKHATFNSNTAEEARDTRATLEASDIFGLTDWHEFEGCNRVRTSQEGTSVVMTLLSALENCSASSRKTSTGS